MAVLTGVWFNNGTGGSTAAPRWRNARADCLLFPAVKIRDYKPSDFERLYAIDQAVFSREIAYSHLELQYYIRSRKSRTLIAEDDGEIVGFVIGCTEPRNLGHLITIDVVPHRQRQRVGSQLLDRIESWLWQQSVKAIYLETSVDDGRARAFYERHGYFILDRLEGYYNGSLDAFVMMKTTRGSISKDASS